MRDTVVVWCCAVLCCGGCLRGQGWMWRELHYQVKWKGFDGSFDSWVPLSGMQGCENVIRAFEAELKQQLAIAADAANPRGQGRAKRARSAQRQPCSHHTAARREESREERSDAHTPDQDDDDEQQRQPQPPLYALDAGRARAKKRRTQQQWTAVDEAKRETGADEDRVKAKTYERLKWKEEEEEKVLTAQTRVLATPPLLPGSSGASSASAAPRSSTFSPSSSSDAGAEVVRERRKAQPPSAFALVESAPRKEMGKGRPMGKKSSSRRPASKGATAQQDTPAVAKAGNGQGVSDSRMEDASPALAAAIALPPSLPLPPSSSQLSLPPPPSPPALPPPSSLLLVIPTLQPLQPQAQHAEATAPSELLA